MKKEAFSTILALIILMISLIMGALFGFFNDGDDKTSAPVSVPASAPVSAPGYVSPDGDGKTAVPIQTPKPEPRPHPKPTVKSYSIGGIGSTDRVPVDLPDQVTPVSVDEKGKKRNSIRIPKELEELGDKMRDHLDAFDEATRKSLKAVLETINLEELSPDEAKIRPKGDGVELRFSIPTGN